MSYFTRRVKPILETLESPIPLPIAKTYEIDDVTPNISNDAKHAHTGRVRANAKVDAAARAGDVLLEFTKKVRACGTYRKQDHEYEWNVYRELSISFLKKIIMEEYRINNGEDVRREETIEEHSSNVITSMKDIEERLRRFKTSPPFTIEHFVTTLLFLRNDASLLVPVDEIDDVDVDVMPRMQEYHVVVRGVVDGSREEKQRRNPFYEEGVEPHCQVRKNILLAERYVRALLKIVSVESSVDDISRNIDGNELESRGYDGGTRGRKRKRDSKNRDEEVNGAIGMEKISWFKVEPSKST